MKLKLRYLFCLDGPIGRGSFALIGFSAYIIKQNLNRIVFTSVFERDWNPFRHSIVLFDLATIVPLTEENGRFMATMLALAVPFIWVGVVLTIRRLWSIGWPAGMVFLFFVPFLNLAFFLLLCMLPAARKGNAENGHRESWMDRFLPASRFGSAGMAMLLTNLLSIPLIWLSFALLEEYGSGMFVGIPFFHGFAAVLIYGYREPRPFWKCLTVASISILLTALLLLALGLDGLMCILMALPVAAPMGWLGGSVGYLIQRRRGASNAAQVLPLLWLVLPAMLWLDHHQRPAPPVFRVDTEVEVDATPETVWNHVVSFEELPEPRDWFFRMGIAYPKGAEIFGSGPGAERRCVFSTGSFVEPIEVWDEPRLLKFSVTSNPPPMKEWTPYDEIHPPHLDGFLQAQGGQFLIESVHSGRTRLIGTTWYRHSLWPAFYWKVWSDELIQRIHMRVLRHIKHHAEQSILATTITSRQPCVR